MTQTPLIELNLQKNPASNPCALDFYKAELLSPADIQQRVGKYPKDMHAQVSGRWLICTSLSPELFGMLSALRVGAPNWGLTVGTTPEGASYATLVCELLAHAHMIMLPLYEPNVCAMVRAVAAHEPLTLQASLEGKRQTLLADIRPTQGSFADLLPLCGELTGKRREAAISELPALIYTFAEPCTRPGAAGLAQLVVSVMLPNNAFSALVA